MPRPRKKNVVGIKIRLATELLSHLEAAARKSKRSFNAEAVARLAQSFAEERALGGEAGRRLMYFIANGFVIAGENYHYAQQLKAPPGGGANVSAWIKDPQTYAAAMKGAVEAMLVGQSDSTREICRLQLGSLLTPTRAFWVKQGDPQ